MKKTSVILCTVFVILFLVVLAALLVLAPPIARELGLRLGWNERNISGLLYAFYCCSVPVAIALGALLLLLRNIRSGFPFSKRTGTLIGVISWCCAAVSVITLVGTFFCFPLLFVSVIMAFMFLIVQVVRLCFRAATELNEENRLTI